MPQEGQKSVTLNEKVYEMVEEEAKKQNKSVAGFVTDLILDNCKKEKEAS